MCFVLVVLYSLALFACTMLANPEMVASIFKVGNLDMWLLLVPLGVCLSGLTKTFSSYQSRQKGFGTIAVATAAQSTGTALSQTALSFVPGLGVGGLIVGNLFGSFVGVVINAASVFHRVVLTRLLWIDSWVQIWQCAKKSKDYPLYYLWADFLCSGAQWLPVIFISAQFSPAAAGAFFLGRRIIRIPLTLLTSNVGKVVYQRSSQFFFEKPAEMTSFITRTCGILFLLGLLPAVVLFVTAEPIFALIFGEPWRQAGQFVMILSPLFLAQFSVGPFGYVFNTLGQQRTYLFWEVIRFSSVLFVFSVIAPGNDLLATIKWYSATLTGVYGLNLVLLLKTLAAGTVDRQAS
jgi:O-antigen/teichoic acid export membrane protein